MSRYALAIYLTRSDCHTDLQRLQTNLDVGFVMLDIIPIFFVRPTHTPLIIICSRSFIRVSPKR